MLLSIQEVCKRLGVSRMTLHRVMASGALPSVKIGDRRLVEEAELRRYLRTLRQAAKAQAA
jgi:excisionase family DNA binding protein